MGEGQRSVTVASELDLSSAAATSFWLGADASYRRQQGQNLQPPPPQLDADPHDRAQHPFIDALHRAPSDRGGGAHEVFDWGSASATEFGGENRSEYTKFTPFSSASTNRSWIRVARHMFASKILGIRRLTTHVVANSGGKSSVKVVRLLLRLHASNPGVKSRDNCLFPRRW